MPKNQQIPGKLEIDANRGVVYFHNNEGSTSLRICRLPKPIPTVESGKFALDITHMVGCNWRGEVGIEMQEALPENPSPKRKPYPEYLMRKVRQRRDLEPNDTSQDKEIREMLPDSFLYEVLTWEGFLGYTPSFMAWVKDIFGVDLSKIK